MTVEAQVAHLFVPVEDVPLFRQSVGPSLHALALVDIPILAVAGQHVGHVQIFGLHHEEHVLGLDPVVRAGDGIVEEIGMKVGVARPPTLGAHVPGPFQPELHLHGLSLGDVHLSGQRGVFQALDHLHGDRPGRDARFEPAVGIEVVLAAIGLSVVAVGDVRLSARRCVRFSVGSVEIHAGLGRPSVFIQDSDLHRP